MNRINHGKPAGFHAERLLALLPHQGGGAPGGERVLVIDSDATTIAELRKHLSRSNRILLDAATAASAREILATVQIDLVVCDPALEDHDPKQFLLQLLEHAAEQELRVVVLDRSPSALREAECYARGADAYFAKPLHSVALASLVEARLRRIADERSRMLQDPITGLVNLFVFREAFGRALSLASREREPLSLGVLHLDMLREIRTVHGLIAADQTLQTLVEAISGCFRNSDLLARWQGDTLLVLLPNTSWEGAQRALAKLNSRLQWTSLPVSRIQASHTPVLAGITEVEPGMGMEEALETAVQRLAPLARLEDTAVPTVREPSNEPRQRPTILLAEDDSLIASIIRQRLERSGFQIRHVMDGEEVLTQASSEDVSLLLLDVKMPFVDGFEALRRLRSMRSRRQLPVILLTSLGHEEDIARGFQLGADDYLVKPFSMIELQARIQRLLRPVQPEPMVQSRIPALLAQ